MWGGNIENLCWKFEFPLIQNITILVCRDTSSVCGFASYEICDSHNVAVNDCRVLNCDFWMVSYAAIDSGNSHAEELPETNLLFIILKPAYRVLVSCWFSSPFVPCRAESRFLGSLCVLCVVLIEVRDNIIVGVIHIKDRYVRHLGCYHGEIDCFGILVGLRTQSG